MEADEGGFRNTPETYAVPLIGAIDMADVGMDHVLQVLLQETAAGPETGPFWTLMTKTASCARGQKEKALAWAEIRGLCHCRTKTTQLSRSKEGRFGR